MVSKFLTPERHSEIYTEIGVNAPEQMQMFSRLDQYGEVNIRHAVRFGYSYLNTIFVKYVYHINI